MPDEDTNGTFISISRREIFQSFQRIEQEVNAMRNDVTTMKLQLDELDKDVNKRVRALELRYYAVLAGMIGSIGALIFALTRPA